MIQECLSNIVKKEQLRQVQLNTLERLSDSVSNSAGPYGSTTQIIKDGVFAEYTKDGYSIIKSIKFNSAIEKSISEEITELARHIAKTVGDGTTSAVMLSYSIFKHLHQIETENRNIAPFAIIEAFKNVTSKIIDIINSNRRDLNIRDVYDIAMICTNSNKEISSAISDIYKEYGKDVLINVGTSFNEKSYVNSYDGLTLESGYATAAYVNKLVGKNKENKSGICEINNARIYAFIDPIDTPEMIDMFQKIVYNNILLPYYNLKENPNALEQIVPTVIISPNFTRDITSTFEEIENFLYSFDSDSNKPPLLIINSTGGDDDIYSDTIRLLGCKPIKKYLNLKIQEKEINDGKAVNIDNVLDSYGEADIVRATALRTTFINPKELFKRDENGNHILDENGEKEYGDLYKSLLAFLNTNLNKLKEENADLTTIFRLNRRIASLKSNTVDYLIGGVSTTDRDADKALVEDAVKNIKSASENGVGFGANFEGFRAINTIIKDIKEEKLNLTALEELIAFAIYEGYYDIIYKLYKSSVHLKVTNEDVDDKIKDIINKSLEKGTPLNIVTDEFDGTVLSSIDSDPVILNAISKIITIMFTTNQCLVQSPSYNVYNYE